MDAIRLLTEDHRKVEKLFAQYQPLAGTNGGAAKKRRQLVEAMTEELSVHAHIEERELYPEAREVVPDGPSLIDEAEKEHESIKSSLAELHELEPESADFDRHVAELIECTRHHVKEEETELFPKLREALSQERLESLGERLAAARNYAPTVPPPASRSATDIIVDAATAAVEKVKEVFYPPAAATSSEQTRARPRRRGTSAKRTRATAARATPTKTRTKKGATAATRAKKTAAKARKKPTAMTRGSGRPKATAIRTKKSSAPKKRASRPATRGAAGTRKVTKARGKTKASRARKSR